MNEQDTAAADTILLLEAEEKVKLRILQVVSDVLWGYKNSILPGSYEASITMLQQQLRQLIREEAKNMIQTAKIIATY